MSLDASSSYLEDPLLFLYPLHSLCVSEELPPPPLSTPSVRTPFCRAGFYLYLAGDWQLTFCTWGKFLGTGPGSVGILLQPLVLGPSLYIYVSLLLSVYPNNHPTPHATSPFGLLFQSGPLLRDEYLARLQLPFISSYCKLKDSIKGPPYCQKVSLPSSSPSLCPSFKAKRKSWVHLTGWFEPSVNWNLQRQRQWVLMISAKTIIMSGYISIYCVNLFFRTTYFLKM